MKKHDHVISRLSKKVLRCASRESNPGLFISLTMGMNKVTITPPVLSELLYNLALYSRSNKVGSHILDLIGFTER